MSNAEVKILDNLHIIRGDDHAYVAEFLHPAATVASQADRSRFGLARQLERIEHILRVTTAADRESNIILTNKVGQLLRKNIFISGIVSPSCHQRDIVGQGQHSKTLP